MARQRTTIDEFDIEGNYGYGHGYEVVTSEPTRFLARQQLKTYRENEPGIPFKIVHRRRKIAACTPEELAAYRREVEESNRLQAEARKARRLANSTNPVVS